MKKLLFILTFFFVNYSSAQTIGSKVSLVGVDGKTYTGVITDIQAGKYKIKYDGYNFDAWLTANQFTITQSAPSVPNSRNNNNSLSGFKVGDKVEALDRVGLWLPAEILELDPAKGYKIHFTGYTGDYYDTWVGNERIRALGSKKENKTTSNTKVPKDPEMNGALPKIVGTAWWLLGIYNKGATPKFNFTYYPYIFGRNGRYEIQFPGMATMGKYSVKGNQLTQVADGSDRLTEVFTIKWNAAGKYLELIGSKTITRLQYNTTAGF